MFIVCLMTLFVAHTKSIALSSRMIINNGLGRMRPWPAVLVLCWKDRGKSRKSAVKVTGIMGGI
jgi:hypothetical protein